VAIIIVVIGAFFFLSIKNSKTIERFKSLGNTEYEVSNMDDEFHFQKDNADANWNGTTIRLAIWKSAFSVIKENLIYGVGTGDYKNKLHNSFKKNEFYYGIKRNFGIHSMYMYVLFSFGMVGFVIFLASLLLPLIDAFNSTNYLFVIIMGIVLISYLTETILNRYTGVVFVAFLVPFLFNHKASKLS